MRAASLVERPGEDAVDAAPVAGRTGHDGGLLTRQVRSGLSWSFFNLASARVLSLASGIVMARLLAPRDFGVFAIALVATELLLSLNDVGLVAALVRHQGDPARLARTAVTLALASSVFLYAALFAIAPAFASAVQTPDATTLIRLLAIAVLIDGVSSVPTGLLTRSLRQDLRTVAELVGVGVTIVTSVGLALSGWGVWSLVWGRLIGNATCAFLILAVVPHRPWPGFNRADAVEMLHFGGPLAGASLVTFVLLNAHYAIVGHILGPTALGFYVLAFNISGWPVGLISQAARRVALAGFSRLAANHGQLEDGFLRAFVLLLGLALPTCLLLSLLAMPLIHVVYGSRWDPAVVPLQLLSVLAAIRVVAYLVEDLLMAVGRSRSVLWLQLSWLVVLTPALVVGAKTDGIAGVAVAQAVVAVAIIPALLFALHRAGFSARNLLSRLLPLAIPATGLLAIALPMLYLLPGQVLSLLLVGSVAAAAYTALVLATPSLRRAIPTRGQA